LAEAGLPFDRKLIHELAHRAHGDAQASLGARGSGADVALSVWGGALCFEPVHQSMPRIRPLNLPTGWSTVWVWTESPASTPDLVKAVRNFAISDPTTWSICRDAIVRACRRFLDACERDDASLATLAIADGADAMDLLAKRSGQPLVTPAHHAVITSARACGGAAKTTGAGGGDMVLAAFAEPQAAQTFRQTVARQARTIGLHIDFRGVVIESEQ
jgi:phosphomevalonate kinase